MTTGLEKALSILGKPNLPGHATTENPVEKQQEKNQAKTPETS
jgi:hypothetical protein